MIMGAHGSIVVEHCATIQEVGNLMRSLNFFNLPNPSNCTQFTQPLTEMITGSSKILLGSRAQPVPKAYNLTAICEPTV
jgi:hypothetical protein